MKQNNQAGGVDFWIRGALRRFAVITVVVWPMFGLYLFINHHQIAKPAIVLMPAWVPFCPAFFLPYFAMLLTTWLLPVAIRDLRLFRACIVADLIAWFLVMPWWVMTPTRLERPPLPDGMWLDSFQMLWNADEPFNVMPCAHGIGPVIAAWFVVRDRPRWRWPLVLFLLIGLPSIALVWQHRPVDIFLGLVAAVIGIAAGERCKLYRVR